jgi:hypothetical protein
MRRILSPAISTRNEFFRFRQADQSKSLLPASSRTGGGWIGMRRFAIARRVRSYRRPNHGSFHVCAYDVTSAFDMALLNSLDRYQVARDGIKRIPKFTTHIVRATEQYRSTTKRHAICQRARRGYASHPRLAGACNE